MVGVPSCSDVFCARDPVFRGGEFGESEQPDIAVKERLEHADHSTHPGMISYHGDVAEIVPASEPERTVFPQRLKLKAREILPDDMKHFDRTPGDHRFGLGHKRVAIIVVRDLCPRLRSPARPAASLR